ncbi:N,N-dimethylformamidase beta subunit family domain-containing protein [Prauserella flavalba]|uniref:N,N-dimethylformamidase beta subunit-like C-terminal domain-containing protein n=1 Tax=Prauserella flavalba TaxID=1477506 RepID=A0A318M204_9PSEU|nr:N,N-dimethylformamidase beta subunit family domain-containing protein [Prauserella flavalba]PXY36565.1 hypothetical protein BA062_14390 [Prauserella flavalba]
MPHSEREYLRLNADDDILNITGYADVWSVRGGDPITFHVSTNRPEYRAEIVELLGGMTDPKATDLPVREVGAACDGTYPGSIQHTDIGSYAELPLPSDWLRDNAFSVQLRFLPTAPHGDHAQVLVHSGLSARDGHLTLGIGTDGRLALHLRGADSAETTLVAPVELTRDRWFFVHADYDRAARRARLLVVQESGWQRRNQESVVEATLDADLSRAEVTGTFLAAKPVTIGDWHGLDDHFNGKIENPRFWGRALGTDEIAAARARRAVEPAALVADYDLGADFATALARDVSGHDRHGTLHQGPQRGVTSSRWDGTRHDFTVAPEHYAAVHFHDDDLTDAAWEPSLRWTVPEDLPAGAYALRLRAGDELDYLPFFVRRPAGTHSDVLFLVPSFTYLAYANERLFQSGLQEDFMVHEMELAPQDHFITGHDEVGKSLYDTHNDGSGVAYSSRLRPVLNLRPHYHNWLSGHVRHLAADLYLLGWLQSLGAEHSVDIALDEDLHREGTELLSRYNVVVTGSHPEYWTRPMMDALAGYLGDGGRLMYLGGNGFYWVTSAFADRPHVIEVRRGNSGTRCWDSPPGELVHSASFDHGGLWRFNGYVPQQFVGVGMAAQGWGRAVPYHRLPDSFDERAAFVFAGIDPDEPIGDFGYVLGGAAGDEVDRYGPDLGTPDHALRLATSAQLDDRYQITQEELLMTAPGQGGTENELVRADLTYFEVDGGGAVFSVGSICWAGSLAWNGYDNNVARISRNVLDRFAGKDAPR